jgi:hypothetical protein
MIHQHLQTSALVAPHVLVDAHLDEDALNAFVEGRLGEREAAPVIKHLVACGYCRRATSQLVRLAAETGPAPAHTPDTMTEEEEGPGRIRRFLEDLASRVLPSSAEDTVFAYHVPAEDFKPRDEASSADKQADNEENDDDGARQQNDSDTSVQ